MIIYFAGVPGGGTSGDCRRERELLSFWKYRLWTFYWMNKDNGVMKHDPKISLFLDSGAFSAWTQNKEVNIYDYIDFIKQHEQYIDVYANLDVIGIGGKQPNELTAKATYKNQKIMEKQGLFPVPVFHIGEPYRYLDYYVRNYPLISLGIAGNPPSNLMQWLIICFKNHICDENGMPKTKVHGFAVTSLKLMLRFPWWSVDSTSWVVIGRNGKIIIPRRKNGNWIYDENSYKISVSTRSPDLSITGQHYQNMPRSKQKVIEKYIEEKEYKMGRSSFKRVDVRYKPQENERWAEKKEHVTGSTRLLEIIEEEGVSNRYQLRDELNIIYFQDLEKSIQPWPWPFTENHKTLF